MSFYARTDLTPEYVKSRLAYDPLTGLLTWLTVGPRHADRLGKQAGRLDPEGYRVIKLVDRKNYFAQRLAWVIHTGEWPTERIDHKNGEKDDNRWVNFRSASHQDNLRNQKLRTDNTSGRKGVHWSAKDKVWVANFQDEYGKTIYLGASKNIDTAAELYDAKAREVYGEFYREL